jgi:hypothetical protein
VIALVEVDGMPHLATTSPLPALAPHPASRRPARPARTCSCPSSAPALLGEHSFGESALLTHAQRLLPCVSSGLHVLPDLDHHIAWQFVRPALMSPDRFRFHVVCGRERRPPSG